jgi:HAD superfamily hydrolase (TIGR01490 family)
MECPRLVIFDLDGTLLPPPSSEVRFFHRMRSAGELSPADLARQARAVFQALVHGDRRRLKSVRCHWTGASTSILHEHARRLAKDVIRPQLRPAMLDALREHQRRGDRIALLSGSPQWIVSAAAKEIGGIGWAIGSGMKVDAGRITGDRLRPYVVGPRKVEIANWIAWDAKIDRMDCIAYSDSLEDLPLFEWVSRPVAVQPDRHLRELFVGRGWACT